jgi:hypothetical protein
LAQAQAVAKAQTTAKKTEDARAELEAKLGDRAWRLNNLYTVEDENGVVRRFELNAAQTQFLRHAHNLNVILKARQLGFTTLICLLMLDACLFNSNTRCGVIAHTRDDAARIYQAKIRQVYDRLPDWLKRLRPAVEDAAQALSFANGSSVRVGTSLRSGTFQWVLVSEYGKICARYPDKAKEVRTGALNTVHAGNTIVIESTAEGAEGHFYELTEIAKARGDQPLTAMDFKLHFFPWWQDARYQLDPTGVTIAPSMARYFEGLEARHGISLSAAQKAWYVKKAGSQGEEMAREYPSTPDEAFRTAIEGAFYTAELRSCREGEKRRIGQVPHDPALPVHAWWDLGIDDYTAVWLAQVHQREVRLIGYREWSDTGLTEVIRQLQALPYLWGYDVMPHDVQVRELMSGRSRKETVEGLGRRVLVAPQASVADGIGAVRLMFSCCWFDEELCADGLKRLAGYRKEWDDRLGVWKPTPRHDENSHGADAFRTGAMMIDHLVPPSTTAAGWQGRRRLA